MYSYIWIYEWLPEEENSYSHLNIEDTTDADCMHAKRVCKAVEIKNLDEC